MLNEVSFTHIDDIRALLRELPGPNQQATEKAAAREPTLTKPPGSLGRLEDIAHWLAAWQGSHPPRMEAPSVLVFAGSHGITAEGVSAYPAEVTAQMLANFEVGGAAINQLSNAFGATLKAVDVNVSAPTKSFIREPAMTETEFIRAFSQGMAAVDQGSDIVCIGEMGIGNTTVAAAICCALYGGQSEEWVGPGTGVVGAAMDAKHRVVKSAGERYGRQKFDGLEILRCAGGGELAAMAGSIVQARRMKVPVVLDGYVCGAAAAALNAVNPGALDHCVAGHVSAEPGHGKLLEKLGLAPILNLDMRLGEASGAAVALGILKAAVACHTGMATFAEAGVSDKD
ncbi:MAG: nicotinate-nucleotide--dimethylbenzimidazole phosphoribosyltransferase [Rhodospirillaceae bacterium]|jgi:nicotinate-nucleotide--dimethylbenzimidazole phosphoribosyltransferase|nr:nicotinate-nucleotide--dimethylbenzimidazole phosphoribosyltransferase [Rhodospirillales bacterium]MBT3907153.1 nicotinate-nucleotide--dimethylbenzimidazole phosphoribosyltransferase [Rhodospirillaceae bacterium]MBT4700236.1 nicotinate-nucleotide--dimethylbenzimidazole phosphoribosyltransferase [Rhodospirillaceae bacterium]MBT5032929.1 nicotinate-nucleotide--dimethylbenzimidazole phosphoribosyltransferase [Rhodospirillaceae bacterium]MBT6219802.1 nicotinate-nucleotide--dimethylbenzimidazole 